MNKKYDFSKAKALIEKHKENLKSASLGMHEDWLWTVETIWEGGQFLKELPSNANELEEQFLTARENGLSMFLKERDQNGFRKYNPEYEKYSGHLIAGLYSSDWATPTIQLEFKDGTDKMIPCYQNDTEKDVFEEKVTNVASRQAELLGCLSAPVQDNITPLSLDEE